MCCTQDASFLMGVEGSERMRCSCPGFNGFCLLAAAMLPKRKKAGAVRNNPLSLFFPETSRVCLNWAGDFESEIKILKHTSSRTKRHKTPGSWRIFFGAELFFSTFWTKSELNIAGSKKHRNHDRTAGTCFSIPGSFCPLRVCC